MPYLLTFPSGRSLLLLRGRGLLLLGGGVHNNRRRGNRRRELGLSRVIRSGWKKHTRENVTNVSDFIKMPVHGFILVQYYCDITQFRFTHPKHHVEEKNCGWQSEEHFKSLLGQLKWNPQKLTAQNTELSVIRNQVNAYTHTHTHHPPLANTICYSQNLYLNCTPSENNHCSHLHTRWWSV